jgi:hypothetical protein
MRCPQWQGRSAQAMRPKAAAENILKRHDGKYALLLCIVEQLLLGTM